MATWQMITIMSSEDLQSMVHRVQTALHAASATAELKAMRDKSEAAVPH